MNQLLDILTPDNIIFGLTAKDKEEILQKLVQKAVDTDQISPEIQAEIYNSLLSRENSMSTGIGSGVAIPHCSVTLVKELKCIMAISKEGLDFEAIDNEPVHIFILLVVPKLQFQEHIRTLAQIAKTLNLKEERDKIIQANNYGEIVAALKDAP